jgi:F0F1-type ATP synthase membrane subunit b/b'
MNTVGFGIFIGLMTVFVMFYIQKVLDNPNS